MKTSDEIAGIKNLIAKGESETMEFKISFDKEAIESAAAFANSKGGLILAGVSNNGEIKGTAISKETLKGWTNEISQSTEPTVIPEITVIDVDDKKIAVVDIKESPIKPVAYKGMCYLRAGNSNKKLSPKEIAEMHLSTIGSSWDSRLCDAKLEDIDLENVKTYIQLANQTGRKKIKEMPIDVLEKVDLIKGNKAAWAAVLLFGKAPQKFVSQARVHCGRFKDEITIIDDEMIEGTIIEQVDKAIEFAKNHLKLKFEIIGEARRKEEWEYPLPAVREAIINAVCHRDYTEPSDIQVRIYDDELVIWSPGRLPAGITLDDLAKAHKSVPRNKMIAKIFFDMAFIESWGTGISRMANACLQQGLPKPVFEEIQGIKVSFRKHYFSESLSGKLNDRQKNLIEIAKKKDAISLQDYKGILPSVPERTLRKDFEDLVKLDILGAIGEKKGRKYCLKAISARYRQDIGNYQQTKGGKDEE